MINQGVVLEILNKSLSNNNIHIYLYIILQNTHTASIYLQLIVE